MFTKRLKAEDGLKEHVNNSLTNILPCVHALILN